LGYDEEVIETLVAQGVVRANDPAPDPITPG